MVWHGKGMRLMGLYVWVLMWDRRDDGGERWLVAEDDLIPVMDFQLLEVGGKCRCVCVCVCVC